MTFTERPAGVNEVNLPLTVHGIERRCLCVLPSAASNGCLVIMLHGTAQRGALTRRITRWDAVAGNDGATVLFPDAVGGYWRDGLRPDDQVNDVAFLRALVAHAGDVFPVRPERVFLVGVSNGGFMAQRMAGEAPELFRGVASVIATLGTAVPWPGPECAPPSLHLIAGSEDPIVPVSGGRMLLRQAGGLPERQVEVLSFQETVARWVEAGGFEPVSQETEILEESLRLFTVDYSAPAAGKRLRAQTLEGAGHHWFGYPIDPAYFESFGRSTQQFDTTRAIWRFFSELLGASGYPEG